MATFIPEKERDHRYGIFHVKYMVKIPYIATRTKEDIREYGMPSSGLKEFDVGQENQLVDRYLSINEMLEYFKNGVNVYVSDYKKTKDIYEAISEYLSFWLSSIRSTFSTNHVPLEDLQELDKFANVVYDKAKWLFTKEIVDDAMMRSISEVSLVNFDTIIAQKPKIINTNHNGFTHVSQEEEELIQQQPPKRDGLMDMFNAVRARRIERNKR